MKNHYTFFFCLLLVTIVYTQNTPPSNSSDIDILSSDFQSQFASFLLTLTTLNTSQGKKLSDSLKTAVFKLYTLLIDYNQKGTTTFQSINQQVKIILQIVDNILAILHDQQKNNVVVGSYNYNNGVQNTIKGNDNIVLGARNVANGNNSIVVGLQATSLGNNNTVVGVNQFVMGNNLTVVGSNNINLIGKNVINQSNTFSVGDYKLNLTAVKQNKDPRMK